MPALLRVVGLGQHAEHLLGRLGGGEVVDEVVVHLLHEIGPRRAAGGDERELAALVDEALHELAGLLHDGEVGGEVGVEHGLEAEAAQGGVERPVRSVPGGRPKASPRATRTDGRDLHHAVLGRVVQRLPHGGGLVVLDDGAGGAVVGALAALHAGRLGERDVAGRRHAGVDAAVEEGKRPDVLHLLADLDAPAAFDALGEVEDDGAVGVVGREVRHAALDVLDADAEVGGERLELAGAVAAAGEAAVGVVGEDELEHGAADLGELAAVGGDLHALDDGRAAGARHAALAGDLHDAQAAGGGGLQVVVLAERGDLDLHLAGGLEDGGAGGHGRRADR